MNQIQKRYVLSVSADFAFSCGGSNQSPIDISWKDATVAHIDDFSFIDYTDTSLDWTIKNNGHSIQVKRLTLGPRLGVQKTPMRELPMI